MAEIPKVRKDMGYPPLVTPLSQMVGTQAVFNVLLGERYKMVPNEIKDYVQGLYGKAPGELNQEIVDLIMQSTEKKEVIPPEDLPFIYEDNKKLAREFMGREPLEEEIVACSIFPEPVREYYVERAEKLKALADQDRNVIKSDETVSFRMVPPASYKGGN